MEEYYRKKLLTQIVKEKEEDYEILKITFQHVKMLKFDRCNKIIEFPLWLLLLRETSYTNIQTDVLEDYVVNSVWIGDIENAFEIVIYLKDQPLYVRSFFDEDKLLKFHEKAVFFIEQKIFHPLRIS